MKKIVLIIALGFSSMGVMAADGPNACTGNAGAGSEIGTAGDGNFVRVPFKPQCSQDTLVGIAQNQVALWGGAGSKKGAKYFSGSTNGGAIVPSGPCAATGCTDVSDAITKAAAMGNSSS